jgi:hypothetical protein
MLPGMQSDTGPAAPSELGGGVGLVFVAVVLCALFTGGALGVVATRAEPATPAGPAARPVAGPGAPVPAAAARGRITTRFKELVRLRGVALRERDPRLLQSVWAPGSPGLRRDQAEVERLRSRDRRWDGLRLPVRVFNAYSPRDGHWMVIARLGRSRSELVASTTGAPLRTVPAATAVYRCPMAKVDGRWLLVDLAPS